MGIYNRYLLYFHMHWCIIWLMRVVLDYLPPPDDLSEYCSCTKNHIVNEFTTQTSIFPVTLCLYDRHVYSCIYICMDD